MTMDELEERGANDEWLLTNEAAVRNDIVKILEKYDMDCYSLMIIANRILHENAKFVVFLEEEEGEEIAGIGLGSESFIENEFEE